MRALLAAGLILAATSAAAQTGPAPSGPGATTPGSGAAGQSVEGAPVAGDRGWRASPEVMAAMRTMRQQCAADMQRLCPEASTPAPQAQDGQGGPRHGGRGRMMQCVRQHQSELSPGCVQAMDALRTARQSAGGAGPAPGASPQG